MRKTDYLLVLLLLAGFFQLLQCGVVSFHLETGSIPRLGGTVRLICKVTANSQNVAIYKTDNRYYTEIQEWTFCSPDDCLSVGEGYNVERSGVSVTITITALSRPEDEKWWTCVSSNFSQFELVVYTVPTSVSLKDVKPCDLATDSCVYTCTTDSCTYPEPSFIWFYSKNNGATIDRFFWSHEGRSTGSSESCPNSEERFYRRTIEIPRYKTSADIGNKTIKLQCTIQFPNLANGPSSGFSGEVKFAVEVSTVTIYDGEMVLKAGDRLTVEEFETQTLRCESGYGHPLPSLTWYIEGENKSSDARFSFTPDNSINGQNVYCKAYNIPGSSIDSVKAILYVKVKIKSVYVEPAWDSTLSVIENMEEPVVCITSGGRPGATIKWLGINFGKDVGPSDSIEHIITMEKLNITRATKNVLISRQGKRRILTCEAWNTDELNTVKANNSKSFNILYPPENIGIIYLEKRVNDAVIDVVRGTNVSLKCTADGNPSVEAFSWNTNTIDSVGAILTIEKIKNIGTVKCTVTNTMNSTSGLIKQGSGSISKKINVLYEASITRFTVLMIDNVETEDTFTVNENAFLTIVCDVDSNPDSYIKLKQSHKVLSERQHGRTLDYNISSAKCSHNGEYICKAWNGIETDVRAAERKIQINVRCSPILAEETDTTVFAHQNSSTILSVTVIAFPMPTYYRWFKNTPIGWREVTNSSDIQITHTALQFNLTFRQIKTENYGEYNLTIDNGRGHPSSFLLLLQAHEDAELQSDAEDNGSMAGIIGGVVGGLLVVCMIIAVLYILRRRKSFDGMKVFLFRPKSTASSRDMGQIGQGSQDEGYSYALVDKPKGQKGMNLIHNSNKPAAARKQDDGPCYENPVVSDDSKMKDKPPKKAQTRKASGKKQPSQSHDGLVYIDVHFEDKKNNASQKKKQKAASKPNVSERVVYDAVQFGVTGESYREEKISE